LDLVAEEVVQIVKVMTGLIRVRFASQPNILVEWDSARDVLSAPRPDDATPPSGGTPPTGGTVRPAA
jgi:hypothetical protein